MGSFVVPPAYPTRVRITPFNCPNRASGPQNHPRENVAVSVLTVPKALSRFSFVELLFFSNLSRSPAYLSCLPQEKSAKTRIASVTPRIDNLKHFLSGRTICFEYKHFHLTNQGNVFGPQASFMSFFFIRCNVSFLSQ